MKKLKQLISISALLAALLIAPAVQAQQKAESAADNAGAKSLLKAIPDNALGFVVVHNLSHADAAISRLGSAMQMPIPGVLTILKMQLGIQQGLDESGSAGIARFYRSNRRRTPGSDSHRSCLFRLATTRLSSTSFTRTTPARRSRR